MTSNFVQNPCNSNLVRMIRRFFYIEKKPTKKSGGVLTTNNEPKSINSQSESKKINLSRLLRWLH